MNKVQRAAQYINEGNKQAARILLKQVIESDQNNETAWSLLYTCLDEIPKKEYCLERVLRINPNNDNARRELEKLLSLGKSILESAVELPVHEEKQVRCFDDEKLRKISSSEIWEVTREVDKLLSYLDSDVSRPQKDLAIREALHLSCNLLSSLEENDIFVMYEETVETGNKALDKYPHQVSSAIELVASDLSMVEEFLNIEIDLLRHAGFEEYAIEKLSKQTRMRLEHLRLHKPSNAVSASELKRQIARMQNHICQQSDKCEKALKDREARSNFWLVLAGLGTIAANIAVTTSIPPLMSSVSATIGGDLVTKSIFNFIKIVNVNTNVITNKNENIIKLSH